MKSSPKRLGLLTLAVLLLSSVVFAGDIPLNNWTVPPYHGSSARGGITTMGEITDAVAFIGVAPCRLVDTRQAGFPAGYGMPALGAGVPRNFDLNNDPLCTGFSSDAFIEAYSLNITATNAQGAGFILIYPQGGAQPPVSTLNYLFGQTVANAAIVPAGSGGGVTVIAGVSGTDLIIDINGYFTREPGNPNNVFYWQSSNTGSFGAARIRNTNSSGSTNVHGVTAYTDSVGGGSAGIYGLSTQTTGSLGVYTFGGKFEVSSLGFDGAGV